MFVRAYDKSRNIYYKSMVYGIFNVGFYEEAILFNPITKSFESVDHFDKEKKDLQPQYEVINDREDGWISAEKANLIKFNHYCQENGFNEKIKMFKGYKEVFAFMLRMLRREKTAEDITDISVIVNEDADKWNYIRTQEDADELMKLFAGFHDSVINKMLYEEEYGKRKLNVAFDNSGWYGVIEVCFEGLIAMNLRPYAENYSREIFEASLIVNDETMFWAGECMDKEDLNYTGTYIKALNMKWRRIETKS